MSGKKLIKQWTALLCVMAVLFSGIAVNAEEAKADETGLTEESTHIVSKIELSEEKMDTSSEETATLEEGVGDTTLSDENSADVPQEGIEDDALMGETNEGISDGDGENDTSEDVGNENSEKELGDVVQNEAIENTEKTDVEETDTIDPAAENQTETEYQLKYQTHSQNIGWQAERISGEYAGTQEQALRVEAIKLELLVKGSDGNYTSVPDMLEYRVHIENIGWQDWKSSGEIAGTTGRKLRVEAIQLRLKGEIAETYDIYYQVHSANFGTLGWAKNGESAGTTGYAKAVEGMTVCLVKKGSSDAPVQDQRSYFTPTDMGTVTYDAHIQNIGWQNSVADGAMIGTQGQSLQMEALRIWLTNPKNENGEEISGEIRYDVHIEDIGWQRSVKEGEMAGTTGQEKRIEAVSISLTGELAKYYDIYYKTHCADFGTLGWAKNGEIAGTAGLQKRLESLVIRLVKKGDVSAPTQDRRSYYTDTDKGAITYKSHVENIGWMDSVADGGVSGTAGNSLQMEGLQIYLTNPVDETGKEISGNVEYRSHAQNIGWSGWLTEGELAGTVGEKKRLEAVQIRLTGDISTKYDIYYQVHISEFGTLGWAKNGEVAGSVGCGQAIEYICIKLVKHGDQAPVQNFRSNLDKNYIGNIVTSVEIKGNGWQSVSGNGATAGTTGESLMLEAMKISMDTGNGGVSDLYSGDIQYKAHLQGSGWTDYVPSGTVVGAENSGNRLEAVSIRLTGELSVYCDVYYRAHVEQYGWLGWAKNGQTAGTYNCSYRMEALQVMVIPKYFDTPGPNENYYKNNRYVDPRTALSQVNGGALFSILNSGYVMDSQTMFRLTNAVAAFSNTGNRVSFLMVDINSGQILTHNSGLPLYSASCIKGPYVLSLLDAGYAPEGNMYNAIKWSSNSDYEFIRQRYGAGVFQNWLERAGVPREQGSGWYTSTTSLDLAKMWLQGWDYLNSSHGNAGWARDTFQWVSFSALVDELAGTNTVYSKAGWIGEGGYYNVYTNAGIVNDGRNPYVVAIMSDCSGIAGLGRTRNLASAIDYIHSQMTR